MIIDQFINTRSNYFCLCFGDSGIEFPEFERIWLSELFRTQALRTGEKLKHFSPVQTWKSHFLMPVV